MIQLNRCWHLFIGKNDSWFNAHYHINYQRWQNAINQLMISMHNRIFNVTSDGVYFQWCYFSVWHANKWTINCVGSADISTNRNRSNNPLNMGIKFRLIVRHLWDNVKRQSARIWQPINKQHTASNKKQINRSTGEFRSHDTALNYYRKIYLRPTWRAHL